MQLQLSLLPIQEDKLGQTFSGMTLKQTVDSLLALGELKQAEKLKSDFEMNETTFAWMRVKGPFTNHVRKFWYF